MSDKITPEEQRFIPCFLPNVKAPVVDENYEKSRSVEESFRTLKGCIEGQVQAATTIHGTTLETVHNLILWQQMNNKPHLDETKHDLSLLPTLSSSDKLRVASTGMEFLFPVTVHFYEMTCHMDRSLDLMEGNLLWSLDDYKFYDQQTVLTTLTPPMLPLETMSTDKEPKSVI
ncbi:hypothetical protein GcC1_037024b [Golovinomyces cichoracearum]|uniref:Uncharacterized protein n=1 Tax=Golovinomyces cichoracearum TaxID=62708 RepID=A0A420J0Q7_9PEZI|nr:hypothetical protein GcC1_037024b [Golovinomyces cichoracearum]